MSQPIIYQIKSWDASNDGVISFAYSGNQVFKNQLIIKNNLTNATVYDQTQTSFQLKHIISANALQNNICYNVQIRVFDKDDNASVWSKIEIFYCFETPSFSFANIVEGQSIQNSAIDAELFYDQVIDPINTYQFFLYNEQKILLNKSQIMYGASMKYTFAGLEDKNQYFIRATGETLNHILLDTGHVGVSVQYITPSLYTIVDLTNIHKQGLIRIHSNFVSIIGKSSPSPPILVDNMVDLTGEHSWVLFDEGYEINGDFTICVDARSLIKNNCTFVIREDKNKYIEIKYMLGQSESIFGKFGFFVLRAFSNGHAYMTTSEYVPHNTKAPDWLNIFIKRVNHIYEIKATVREVVL